MGNLLRNALGALMIFFLLSTAYSWLAGDISTAQDISLSELATDISKGLVAKITVDGDKIFADYVEDGKTIQTKKEVGTALSQTFANLGVPTDKLDKVKIEIKEQSGMGYWLLGLAPFLLPIFFIAFFIWYLTRQVRGAGMQALSFGQSKARLTAPDDQKQRITFKDIAGVKEAKEELAEIVDFLKSPKRFRNLWKCLWEWALPAFAIYFRWQKNQRQPLFLLTKLTRLAEFAVVVWVGVVAMMKESKP